MTCRSDERHDAPLAGAPDPAGGVASGGCRRRWEAPFELAQHQRLDFGQAIERVTAALCFGIDLTLETTREIMAELGHPERCYRCVQVAGTNGKTSTSRYTAALLAGEGLLCGLYTSPHLVSYVERVEVGGHPVSEEAFARGVSWALAAWERVRARNAEMARLGCTEFELLTAAATVIFAEAGVDVAVLEVGLGGRWDATSAVRTQGCCVTGIGLDHMRVLGDTLGQIAQEKAAVIHAGNPCVLGPDAVRPEEVAEVMLGRCAEQGVVPAVVCCSDEEARRAEARGLPATRATVGHSPDALGDELSLSVEVHAPACSRAVYDGIRMTAPVYQASNVGCALALATALMGRPLDPAAARRALRECPTPGRFEVVRTDPLVLLDACHNPQSARAFARALRQVAPERSQRPALLFAALSDKDHLGIARVIAPLFDEIVVTQSDSPRALPAEVLADEVRQVWDDSDDVRQAGASWSEPGRSLTVIADLGAALEHLRARSFVCCGTITLIGQVKGMLLASE